MSLEQHEAMRPAEAGAKTYALVYSAGPHWIAGRPVTEQNLGAHRAYIGKLYAAGRVLCGGSFLDDEAGGITLVRADSHKEATALLADDPAIKDGIFTGVIRHWHAVFDEAKDLRAAHSNVRMNKCAVQAMFEAVDHRDHEGVRAAYAKNITIHEAESLPYGGDYSGPDGAMRHGQGFRTTWHRFQQRAARGLDPKIIADGDHVIVLWRHKLENTKTRDRLDLPAVSVYRMENARVVDSRMFHFDTTALLRFLKRNPEPTPSHIPEGARWLA